MQLNESYVKEIRKHLGYMAFWLPDSSYGLGTIGVIDDDGVFDPISDLESMGIPFEVEQRPGKSNIDYSSAGNVTLNTKSAGKLLPGSKLTKADVGFVLDMGRKHSILFQANEVTTTRIKDKVRLGKGIARLYKDEIWKKEWVVITELKTAASTTIVISSSRNSHVELKVTASAKPAKLDIADASLGLDIVSEKGVSFKAIAEGGLTPLFKVSGISIDNITRHASRNNASKHSATVRTGQNFHSEGASRRYTPGGYSGSNSRTAPSAAISAYDRVVFKELKELAPAGKVRAAAR